MKTGNRDLLVLLKEDSLSQEAMEHEVEFLNTILFGIENLHSFCIAHEIIDLNLYKIIQKPHLIQKTIREKGNKPFIFVCNKN